MAANDLVLLAHQQADDIPRALTQLRRYHGLSDTRLAELTGITRPTLANKLKGTTPITSRELAVFSALFHVPVAVLYEGADATLRWVLDNPESVPDLHDRNFRCSPEMAGAA